MSDPCETKGPGSTEAGLSLRHSMSSTASGGGASPGASSAAGFASPMSPRATGLDLAGTADLAWIRDFARRTHSPVALLLKRTIDVVVAVALMILAAPLVGAVMVLIHLTNRGGALFIQPRIGYLCDGFKMYKLRTMIDGAEEMEEELLSHRPHRTFFKLENDPRTTRLGRFLRKYSIDEFPQLLNVLKGEMSLVGPRPLLRSDFRKFPRSEQMRRFSIRPGLTGLWQVSGRSLCTDQERMRLDLEYVDRWSLWMDFRILLRTVSAVLSGRGAT